MGIDHERRRSERPCKPCSPCRDRFRGGIAFTLEVRWCRGLNHQLQAGIPSGESAPGSLRLTQSKQRGALCFRAVPQAQSCFYPLETAKSLENESGPEGRRRTQLLPQSESVIKSE